MSRSRLLAAASAAALLSLAPVAFAQTASGPTAPGSTAPGSTAPDPASPSAPAAGQVAEVVVTGTRTPRSRLDTVAPVDVVAPASLQRNGSTELSQTLSTTLPSLNFPRPTLTDGTDSVRPVTLRGLAPDQVLVLVNSKRRQASALVNLNGTVGRGSSSVDLNTIPVVALGQVEVLRDGASAQYGSDAIAGVVNLRLREADHGGYVSVTSGVYDTDVDTKPAAAPAGATWQYPSSRHVEDGWTTTASGWVGLPLFGPGGFLTLSAETKNQSHTTRAGPDLRPQYPLVNGAFDPREGSIERIGNWYGDPNLTQYTLFANAGADVGNGVHLYGWGSYQHRHTVSGGTFRRPCTATVACPTGLTTSSSNSSIQNIASVYPNGFLPKISPEIEDASLAGGAKFKLAGWDVDASLVWGDNKIHYHVIDSINVTLGPASPQRFDAGQLEYSQAVANLGFVRQFPVSFAAEPINVAAGVEYRHEEYQITPGEVASYVNSPIYPSVTANGKTVPAAAGSQVFPGFTPANATDATRDSYAGYLDVDVHPIEHLDVDGAVRAEHYDGFGGVTTGKLAARYDFNRMFAIRGSISNGFRAPSLQQVSFTSTTTTFINNVPYQIVTAPAGSPTAALLGSTPLKPEKSENYSGGFVFRFAGLNVTLDAYKIKITNRIVLSENLTAANVVALLPPGISGVRFFTNGVDTDTKGAEAVATYRWNPASLNIGAFDLSASYTHNETKVTRLPSTNVLSALNPAPVLFGRVNTLIFQEGQPKDKAVLGVDWTRGYFGATVRATYYGNVLVPGTTAANDYDLGYHTLVDAEFRVQPTRHVQAAIGVNNLFDSYPNATPNSTGGAFSSYSPFGFDGRFMYARLAYSW